MVMPGYRRGFSRRRGALRLNVVHSMKNSQIISGGLSSTAVTLNIAKAVDNPASATGAEEVAQGSVIKAVWIVLDVCGLGGTGVLNNFACYIIKNPGANLTVPNPIAVGTSNEKKFIFKEWSGMIMRNQDGNAPLHWEGWVKIPRRYQRMGTDDIIQQVLVCSASVTGHFQVQHIYKWFE